MFLAHLNLPQRGRWIILFTVFLGLIWMIIPLGSFAPARPAGLLLVLIYWATAVPNRVSIGAGWWSGLLLDIVTGTLLGQHSLAYCIVLYMAQHRYPRFQVYIFWLQLLALASLLVLYELTLLGIRLFIQEFTPEYTWGWLSIVTSLLLWPLLFVILSDIRRRYQVSA